LPGLIKNVLSGRNTDFSLTEIERFAKENEETLSTAQREVKQAIEKTRANVNWMKKNYEPIRLWLEKQ